MQLTGRKWNTGGWANNAFNIKMNDACKNLDKILGKNWNSIREEVGLTCPAQPVSIGKGQGQNDLLRRLMQYSTTIFMWLNSMLYFSVISLTQSCDIYKN